ncbi:MAG TPA: hypothetical protein VHT27_00720 [Solirubrobacteraceae bacterium]|jgi:hypothetical protein|nr:hypothetical protein [Solirubrobacteraceae bacterium]
MQIVEREVGTGSERAPAPGATADATAGNERLTALAGVVLLVPLAVIGVTILQLGGMLSVHLFVGLLLVPPVLLKLGSTLYRFGRYYTHSTIYRLRGAPPLALRALGPAVVITTVVVFVTGIWLLFAGPGSRNPLLEIHKVSFIAWGVFTGIHLLAHALEARDATVAELARSARVAGRKLRLIAIGAALVAGIALGAALIPQYSSWTNWNAHHHHHRGG